MTLLAYRKHVVYDSGSSDSSDSDDDLSSDNFTLITYDYESDDVHIQTNTFMLYFSKGGGDGDIFQSSQLRSLT